MSIGLTWSTEPQVGLQGESEPTADQGGCHDKTADGGSRSAREREAAAALKSNFTSPVERKTERECGLKILIHKMGNKRKQAVRNKIKLADGCISIFLYQNGLCQISRTINNLNTDNNFPHANPNPER